MNGFIEYLKELYNQGFGLPIEYWLIFLLIVFLTFLIGIKSGNSSNNKAEASLYFGISIAKIRILICILGFILFASIISFIFFYQDYFVKQHYALDIIVMIFGFSVALISIVLKLNKGVKTKLPKYIKPPLSLMEKTKNGSYIRNVFEKLKWRVICLIIPFSILLFHSLVEQEAEVSILIDNSGSTDMYRNYGQRYLANAIDGVYDNTHFNISYFSTYDDRTLCDQATNSLKKNVNEIVKQNKYSSASIESISFNKSQSASAFFRDNNINNSCLGTPLLEGVWSNFVFTLSNANIGGGESRILIIMTDGEGNLYTPENGVLQHQTVPYGFDIFDNQVSSKGVSMYDFYDEIAIINIGENDDNEFFSNFNSIIYDGYDKFSYLESLKAVTKSIKKRNWNFIYIIAFLSLISIITILSIKLRPVYKQNN